MENKYNKRQFAAGDIVRHFRRETADPKSSDYLYEIIGEGENSETGEPVMVYRALYGTKKLYVRPLDMFMSETDHKKYPEIRQKYRFEKADTQNYTASFTACVTDEGACVDSMIIDYGDIQPDDPDGNTFSVYMSSTVDAGADAGKPYAYYNAAAPIPVASVEKDGSKVIVHFVLAKAPLLTWLKELRNAPAKIHFTIVQNSPFKAHTRDGRDMTIMGSYTCEAESWKDLYNEELSQFTDVQDTVSYQYHRGTVPGLIAYFHGNGEGDLTVMKTHNNAAQILANRGGAVFVNEARRVFGDVHVMAFQAPDMWYHAKKDGLMKICGDEIEEVIRRENIDRDRVWIAGISAGGFMTVRMVLAYPDLFRAAMVTCPALDAANARSRTTDANLTDEELAQLKNSDTAIWLVQGETDSAVDPELCSKRIWKFISENEDVRETHFEGDMGIGSPFTTYETSDGKYRMSLFETSDLTEITGISGEKRPGGKISSAQDYGRTGKYSEVKYNDHWTWVFTFRDIPCSADGTHIFEWAVK